MALLTVQNITKYFGEYKALDNVSLDVPEKSIFGLLGPNGAGKTTLIRIVNQIYFADQGEVLFKGEKINTGHIANVGYLPEERGLYKKMKVGEQLLYLAQLKSIPKDKALEQIKDWMIRFEMKGWWNKKVEDLSKGMQQKVQFIATVLHQPSLIILDEPFSGFDPVNADHIKNEILKLREAGTTVIFSTHRMESVEELCDDIALIHKSKLVLEGQKKVIKEKFRDHTFELFHRSPFEISDNGGLKLLSQDKTKELNYQSIIHLPDDDINAALRQIADKTEIISFRERIPTIHDIFIKEVTQNDHE
ncbi:MAG TPA: ABC transporter ATP-binding protein [Cytophagales bacterium]|nr:ABC transporter ATP-binding protein [Cytophagales bacterium]